MKRDADTDSSGDKKANYQKIKLLKLYNHLLRHSDESSPLSTQNLLDYLAGEGIPCDRRTLSKDIDVLNEYGYEVQSKVSRQKSYYVPEYDRTFEEAELGTLIDAVQAARFINPEKTDDLVGRLANLGGEYRSNVLRDNIVIFNTNKSKIKSIFSIIDAAKQAIRECCKLSFRYFDLDENRCKVMRNDGEKYLVSPMALIYRDDAYYLMCFKRDGDPQFCYYRLDRMESVSCIAERVEAECLEWKERNSISDEVKQSMRMFIGKQTEEVTLMYAKNDYKMLGAIYDKFGDSVQCSGEHPHHPNYKLAKVRVRISPTFWAWLVQFGGKIMLLEDRHREQLLEFLRENTAVYNQ